MSTPNESGPWSSPADDPAAHQTPGAPAQEPWAHPEAGQDTAGQAPAAQQYGQQNPYGPPPSSEPTTAGQSPYGQASASDMYGQASASDPYGQQGQQGWTPAGTSEPSASDPFGQASASDPYGQGAASDPYGQHGQQGWTPAGGDSVPPSDPYGQQPGGQYPQQPGGPYGAPQPGAQQQAGAQPLKTPPPGSQAQSRLLVGLLGIFLGGFGVHRFLMGYTTIGIIQIAVTVVTCGVGMWWGLIEGIMVLAKSPAFERDAYGRPLTD